MVKELLLSALVALGILFLYAWLWWIRKGIYDLHFNRHLPRNLSNRHLFLFQKGTLSMLLSLLFSPSYKKGEEILSFGTLLRLFLRFFLFLFSLQLLLSLSLSLLFNYQLQWQDRLFLILLMPLILFDLRYYLIPDPLLYPLLWCGILLSLLQLGSVALESALLGVMGGYLLFEVCYWSGVLFVRREIMGRGDIKLFAALLAWVGVQNLSQLLLLSALLGLGYGFLITLKGILLQRRAEKLEGSLKRAPEGGLERALEVKIAKNLGDKVIPFAPALGFSGIILYFNLQIFGN